MGASDAFLEAVKTRRSNYTLSSETTIPDSKVVEIVQTAIKHAPSTYNVQSARAVVLFGESHHKFWDIATSHISALPMDENAKKYLTSRLSGFRGAHGTVLFFEDQAALDTLGTKNAMVQPMLTEFWTALTAEGLGCNLQHYNFLPAITAETLSAFGLPETWKLKAQLVFGKPTAPPLERSYLPIEERVLVKE
ncbi:putative nitroreductase [Exophiala dermatitidis]|nr:putative nitroreductase [Exophiala dermatitidis]KAJ4554540.1 putative nitroreductase [Exophiala dermatitidis]